MTDLLFKVLPAAFGAFGLFVIMVFKAQDDRKRFIAFLAQIIIGGHNWTSFGLLLRKGSRVQDSRDREL
jgi:hypothetical protein